MLDTVKNALSSIGQGNSLDSIVAGDLMAALMTGQLTNAQVGALLGALAVRGPTADEVVGFATALRRHVVPVTVPTMAVDNCGTGGDGAHTFNISTAAAIVASAGGIPMAKHGNRSVSSRSGSADVLEHLGANIQLTPRQASTCLERTNLCFLFAPAFHPAMKYVASIRKELGFRTIFNLLGPLVNPAGVNRQVIGVYQPELVPLVAHALAKLGTHRALIVHGDGLDEFGLHGVSTVAEVNGQHVREYYLAPDDVGLLKAPRQSIEGGGPKENAKIIMHVLQKARGPARDIVVFNAAAVLYVADAVSSMREGVRMAEGLIDSGRAEEQMYRFVNETQQFKAQVVSG